MKHSRLRRMLFLALCCDFGLFAKQLIAPAANIVTDALHIPGGIGTSFSLMFVVIAAAMVQRFGCAAMMSIVQSLIALAIGRVGSMGALSPIGYIAPGIVVDVLLKLAKGLPMPDRLVLTNSLASVCASLTANMIVFHLKGAPLILYLSVAAVSGAVCGLIGAKIVPMVSRAVSFGIQED